MFLQQVQKLSKDMVLGLLDTVRSLADIIRRRV
jgi:hypothetical protein